MKHGAIKSTVTELKRRRAVIAKERDKLLSLESDISQLAEDCDDALESLSHAIDALSRLQ